jgi:hypothetical protein
MASPALSAASIEKSSLDNHNTLPTFPTSSSESNSPTVVDEVAVPKSEKKPLQFWLVFAAIST